MSIEVYPAPSPTPISGPTAEGAAAATPPVLIAGADSQTGTGNVRSVAVDSTGNLSVAASKNLTDGTASGSWGAPLTNRAARNGWATHGMLYNGATLDMQRANVPLTLLASAARTTTTSSADQTSHNARGVEVFLNVTSAGTGSITLKIESKDPVSGGYATVLTGGTVMANGLTRYVVYPGTQSVPNANASDVIGRTWRVTVTHANANAITYSVGAHLLL